MARVHAVRTDSSMGTTLQPTFGKQLGALLWKDAWIARTKRSPFGTILEFLIPLGLVGTYDCRYKAGYNCCESVVSSEAISIESDIKKKEKIWLNNLNQIND